MFLSSIPAIALVRPPSKFKGITIVLIEQTARQALQIADYGLALKEGQIRIEDTASQIVADPQIAQLFLSGGLVPVEGVS